MSWIKGRTTANIEKTFRNGKRSNKQRKYGRRARTRTTREQEEQKRRRIKEEERRKKKNTKKNKK